MEFFELEQLAAFAEEGTLSAAAERLHLSQPTLTRTMKHIEEELAVPLFTRTKNRLELNENGVLAAEQAQKLLSQRRDMVQLVQAAYRTRHTIHVGGCSTIPTAKLVRMLSEAYPEMTISSELRQNTEQLLESLLDDTYQFIILPEKPSANELFCKAIEDEHLMFSLPKDHPRASAKGLYLAELNGQNMIVLPNTGFWEKVIDQKMPDSKFLVQTGKTSFEELIQASVLPSFTSNLALLEYLQPEGRVTVPILDPEVNVTFYLVGKKESLGKYEDFLFLRPN